MTTIDDIIDLLQRRGHSQYGGEAVTQLEHALQAATLAESENANAEWIVAALLHDVGHLLHELPDDAPEVGTDDRHETAGQNYLRRLFPDAVTEPVRLHVAAKRYLCTTRPGYLATLSPPSLVSYRLQGAAMSADEVDAFENLPYSAAAISLRHWDDAAKVPELATPELAHFVPYVLQVQSAS